MSKTRRLMTGSPNPTPDEYEADLERSIFIRRECEELMCTDQPKKAYTLYLTDPLGTKADFETFVAHYRDQVGEKEGIL